VLFRSGILHKGRTDIQLRKAEFVDKWKLFQITNKAGKAGGIEEALQGADVCIALSQSGPDVIHKDWIRGMAKDAIVFACANPIPEIWPWEAKEAGAAVVATGRSDFPNQVNNSLGFPGIFRGTLDVHARTITDEMCIAASGALAGMAEKKGLNPDYILPNMDEWEVFPREAAAVAMKAQEQGVARLTRSYDEEFEQASAIIGRARNLTKRMMEEGFIARSDD
jgi:malate dehydrogenase (oxaloacetate-decarboxylating)